MQKEVNPEIFFGNKWNILKAIAETPQSPSDIALSTNTSLSNILQQLKLLEAYSIVHREKSDEKSAGKPRTIYYLNTEMAYAVVLKDGMAEHKTFYVDHGNEMFFNIFFKMSQEDVMFMLKFSFKYEEVLKKCKSIGFLKSSKDSIELFLITDHLDEIRSKFSNIFIDDHLGKIKKIVNWSHNEFEVNEGLHHKDKYFMDMVKNVHTIHDPSKVLSRIKEVRENIQ
ncbi:MAG: winged helix-turn-helix domain-containing protein [Candidatus Woesearchaeota archaeon]